MSRQPPDPLILSAIRRTRTSPGLLNPGPGSPQHHHSDPQGLLDHHHSTLRGGGQAGRRPESSAIAGENRGPGLHAVEAFPEAIAEAVPHEGPVVRGAFASCSHTSYVEEGSVKGAIDARPDDRGPSRPRRAATARPNAIRKNTHYFRIEVDRENRSKCCHDPDRRASCRRPVTPVEAPHRGSHRAGLTGHAPPRARPRAPDHRDSRRRRFVMREIARCSFHARATLRLRQAEYRRPSGCV